ncbi:hypothetical protein [Pseudonocardia sediminis]|nr:hypothetical protein [Pseudonocardia sediminis]
MEAAERGEAVIGGCIVRPGRDDRCCLGCGRRWSTVLLALPRWPRTVPPENLPDGLHPAAVETLLERHDVTSRVCRALEATNGRYDTPGPRAAYAELLQWIGLRFEIDPVSPHRSGIDELVVPADRVWPARLLLAATDVCDALTMLWSASIREYDQDLDRITRAVERHQRLEALVRLSPDAPPTTRSGEWRSCWGCPTTTSVRPTGPCRSPDRCRNPVR